MDFTIIDKLVPTGWHYRVGYNINATRNTSGLFKAEEGNFHPFAANEKGQLYRGLSAESFEDLVEKLKQLIKES